MMSIIFLILVIGYLIYWGFQQHTAGNMTLWTKPSEIFSTFLIYLIPVITFALLSFLSYIDVISLNVKSICYLTGLIFIILTVVLAFSSYEINKDTTSFLKSFFMRFFIALISAFLCVITLILAFLFQASKTEESNG